MRPQGNGLVEIAGEKKKEKGFNCMKLIIFLTNDNVTEWEDWHQAHELARQGECPYKTKCPIYAKTISKINGNIKPN